MPFSLPKATLIRVIIHILVCLGDPSLPCCTGIIVNSTPFSLKYASFISYVITLPIVELDSTCTCRSF